MVRLSESGKKALDRFCGTIAQEKKIPGFVFGATTADEEIYFNSGGYKGALFWICSMTKLLAHIAALQLIEQGKLTEDTLVSKFFPEFANPVIVHDTVAPNLHTTPQRIRFYGLFYNYAARPDKPLYSTIPHSLIAPHQKWILKGDLPGIPIKFEPGTDFVYGYSSDVLGFVVEKVTGQTLEQYLQENIFGPLGIQGSFYMTPELTERLITLSFRRADGGLEPWADQTTRLPERDPSKVFLHFGGIGLFTSLNDYLTLLRHILQIYSGKLTNGILTQATVREMFEPASNDAGMRSLDLYMNSQPGNRWSTALAICGTDWPRGDEKELHSVSFVSWSGWAGTYYFMDASTGIAAVFGTQIVPSRDPEVLKCYVEFEETLYSSLEK
ncbi:beta-lactamase/transpeptidase-like protein [Gymnopilus junonius]|uniref:Beta-lactamase/transpeptidase-like protein n=1 Tax=Gymnopilus junonius TaxID=109634 RepID=A0A9P5N9A0_GYMJU|nr:beta-lactamase/transpeptidase-like protein [Gymnopilus junonius]